MFWFYIWKPKMVLTDEDVFIDIDWFWECLSWCTRNQFIETWINKKLIYNWKNTIWDSDYPIFIRYWIIKDNLEKIRYTSKIYWTDDFWIDRIIKQAIEKYWEDNLFCEFTS